MQPDEPGAILMLVDEQRTFINNNNHTFCVIHKTASAGTAQDIANFFAHDPAEASTHYIIGQDGTIVQAVLEKDGAAGNCCTSPGYASFIPAGVNLNNWSVSIEHCDPASDNSTPLTAAQKAASFRLVEHICERHNIPKRRATTDGNGGIIGHMDIDPVNRARCPGNYPWEELWTYLKGVPNVTQTPVTNEHAQQSAKDCWWSTSHLFAGMSPSYDTGIAKAWQVLYSEGKKPGAPLTAEYGSVDWSGNAIRVQEFANTRCEWHDGAAKWYPSL